MTRSTLAITAGVIGLVGMAYCHLSDVGMKFEEHVYYMAALFCGNIAASLALVPFVAWSPRLPARWARLVWLGAAGLAAATVVGFVWSRTIGFPQMADHVGEWDALGMASVACEVLVVAASTWMLAGLQSGAMVIPAIGGE